MTDDPQSSENLQFKPIDNLRFKPMCDRLFAWLKTLSYVCEDGLVSPSEESIWSALRLIAYFLVSEKEQPRLLIENGDGGITLSWFDDDHATTTEYCIDKDGSIEKIDFVDSKLVSREAVFFHKSCSLMSDD